MSTKNSSKYYKYEDIKNFKSVIRSEALKDKKSVACYDNGVFKVCIAMFHPDGEKDRNEDSIFARYSLGYYLTEKYFVLE